MEVQVYQLHEDRNKLVAPHFKVKEFACRDGTDPVFIDLQLVGILEDIRMHFKKPVHISSAYRTVQHNKNTKGSSMYSKHCLGMAADIYIAGIKPQEVADYARQLMPDFGGIGVYSTFTHIDTRAVKTNWKG